ncbi:MAG: Gx transporter family protein [Spirochaetales bacterium]
MPHRSNPAMATENSARAAESAAACGIVSSRFSEKADVTALLGAFCFFLSAIEYMLPKPMPFMRLGIANLPILLAVDLLPFPWFVTLAIVKVIGMSVISGSLFSFVALFSLAGTLTAALVMWASRKLGGRLISQIGVSILGALTSNAVQVVLARYVVFGQAAWLIAPLFLVMGLVTGTALGIFAEHFARRSRWYACAAGLEAPETPRMGDDEAEAGGAASGASLKAARKATAKAARAARSSKKAGRGPAEAARRERMAAARAARKRRFEAWFSPLAAALAGAVIAVAFLFENSLALKLGMFFLLAAAAHFAGKRLSFVTTIIVSAGIIITNLLVPSGKVLAHLGPLAITQFALTEGIMKALTFEGLMLLSKASIMPGLKIPGKLGGIVALAFVYYDHIIEYKGRIRAATLSADADAMMSAVWEHENLGDPAHAKAAGPATPAPTKANMGNAILIIAVLVFVVASLLF